MTVAPGIAGRGTTGGPPSPIVDRRADRAIAAGGIVAAGALLVAGIGVGASVMSCVGQSFSLRQARALEGIEQQLQLIQQQQQQQQQHGTLVDPAQHEISR